MGPRRRHIPVLLLLLLAVSISCRVRGQSEEGDPPLIPETVVLDEAARQAIDAPYLTEAERRDRRIFHGVWEEADLADPAARARVALNAWDLMHPSLSDPAVPAEIRAEANLRLGELAEAIRLLEGCDSIYAMRIRAQALADLGRYDEARTAAEKAIVTFDDAQREDPEALTEVERLTSLRARLHAPASDEFHYMIGLLTRVHQDLDRLHWPARLEEARLLVEKYNEKEAIDALHETLRLNPRCADAWHMLGLLALGRFDFDSVQAAVDRLHLLNPEHPLASLLLAESRLVRDDPDDALRMLGTLLRHRPRLRPALALKAAAHAAKFEWPTMRETLEHCDSLSPGSADAYYVAGSHLSAQYQYDEATALLAEAMRRLPSWSAPHVEMALLEMRRGRDGGALEHLRAAAGLDPFNKRAANSLLLMEELVGYEKIETDHFVLRYRPGVDRVVADMMSDELEHIHDLVSGRFEHEPAGKTLIELMPDRRRFAVRLTGLPRVGTIAACTGPMIAMEVPREGAKRDHHGNFDWPRVLRHEYTHTVTLSRTEFRIPRWLTEGAAEVMELASRDYDRCRMLAASYVEGNLFDLDAIDWAFVRPENRGDVTRAYAQGHWMTEFINEQYGEHAVIALMEQYLQGLDTDGAMQATFGMSSGEFFRSYQAWARRQVRAWGLAAEPSITELTDQLRWADPELALVMAASQQARLDAIVRALTEQIGRPATRASSKLRGRDWPELVRPPVQISDEQLARWRSSYPDHPDLLEMELRRRIDDDGRIDPSLVPLLERYAELRPVDPYPHKKLVQFYLGGDDPSRAIEHLEYLDARAQDTVVYALELARIYRGGGDIQRALAKITRVLEINPYHAANRELAAAIALEAGRYDLARRHIFALTLLEPDRPRHQKRLERVEALMAGEAASLD